MITLTLDKDKVLTIAMLPYPPSRQVMELASQAGEGDFDKIKMIAQIQILKIQDNGFVVLNSAILTPAELSQFFHLAQAVGKSLENVSEHVDKYWDKYRKLVTTAPPEMKP